MTLLTVNGIVWTKINNEWLSSTNEVIINPSQIVSISQIKNRGFGDGNYLANFPLLGINQLEINSEDYEKIQLSGGGGGGDVDPQQVRDIALSVVQEESPNILTSASIETSSIVSTYVDGILTSDIPDIAIQNANEAIRSAISTGLSLDTTDPLYKLVIEDANYQE